MKNSITTILIIAFSLFIAYSCSEGYKNGDVFIDNSGSGKGGSMARFTVAADRLYAVDGNSLRTFNISTESIPVYSDSIYLSNDIETIFPYENNLFIGAQNGLHIYDISSPDAPVKLSQYTHITSCDPVVTDGSYAYVTLNSLNSWCGNWVNELHIVNIKNLSAPYLAEDYSMSGPRGLAVNDNYLYVCDNGLKIYDKSLVYDLKLLAHFNEIQAYDVIPDGNRIIVIGEDGFYQYQFDGKNITLLSKIEVKS